MSAVAGPRAEGDTAHLRVTLYLGGHKIGPGKIQLLEAIEQSGSISGAARAMNMAYRHAWEMVDDLNDCFREAVVSASTGGRAGGGAELTPFGRQLIERFREIEELSLGASAPQLKRLRRHIQ